METLVHQIQFLVLRVFAGILPVVFLAWVLVRLNSRKIHSVDRLRKTVASMPPVGRVLFCALLAVLVVYGSTKDGGDGTNEPPRRMSAPRRMLRSVRADAVAAEDIAHGWRVVSSAEAEAPVALPEGAVTNDLLRRRGGFDWAFRVEPEGWRFPWRGGVLTGVTVLARGEVRPDVGTLYFPVPVTNGVSLLPEARWGLLPGGGASVFSHAATTNGSLILDWRNALVGRDITSPTNLQLELYGDGRFVWRTAGGSTSYRPVLPFDWDGDGLENSVDPDPLLADAADAHGTNAEWYRVVCSNVFESAVSTTGATGVSPVEDGSIQFRSSVNTNAYYFVDVVAANGPAPVYFTADCVSRLGSPAVVARAGETNRVPLLVGVTYALTSSVPIRVELPTNGFAEVVSSCENACTLRWPLNFDFSEGTGRTYTASISPRDPGGTFIWTSTSSSGSASLLSASADSSCSCWTGFGPLVTYSCSPICGCSGGCLATGSFHLEGASFSVSLDGCRCGFDDPAPDDGNAHESSPEPTGGPSFSIDFSKSAVIFEDAYDDSPGVHRPKHSTRVRLTVSAYGGPNGGTFVLAHQNLDRLSAVFEGPIDLPSSRTLASYESFYTTYVYEAESASDSEGDISVAGYFIESETGNRIDSSANLTVVKIELQTLKSAPENQSLHRHHYGIGEKILVRQIPGIPETTLNVVDARILGNGGNRTVEWGVSNLTHGFTLSLSGTVFDPHTVVCIPSGIEGVEPKARTNGLPGGVSGGLQLVQRYRVLPLGVNFEGLSIEEVPCFEVIEPTGYFRYAPTNVFFRSHTVQAGAGNWIGVESGNYVGDVNARDSAGYLGVLPRMTPQGDLTDDSSYGWLGGSLTWRIPFGWKGVYDNSVIAEEPVGRFAGETTQEVSIDPSGDFSVIKLQHTAIRQIDGSVSVDGRSGVNVILR